MKKVSYLGILFAISGIIIYWYIRDSDADLVRRNEILHKHDGTWFARVSLRNQLVNSGYLTRVIYDMPNTRYGTTKSKNLWNAMIRFRDKQCSSVASFSMGPADDTADILYVTVTDIPSHVQQWKNMLVNWDSETKESVDKQKRGPESVPTD